MLLVTAWKGEHLLYGSNNPLASPRFSSWLIYLLKFWKTTQKCPESIQHCLRKDKSYLVYHAHVFFVTVLFKLAIQPLRDGTDLRENVQTALGNFRVMCYVIYVISFPVEKAKKTFWFTKLLSFFETCSTLCVFRVSQEEFPVSISSLLILL